jgi:aminoglycoside phosphotransferase (APT) family kinase protein
MNQGNPIISMDRSLAAEICRRAAIGKPVWISEPLPGEVNESFLFLLENGRRWVCRLNVHDREVDKIRKEAKTYRWLHQVAPDLPLALDYLPDCSKSLLPVEYALIPFLEGRGVGEAIESMPNPKRSLLMEEIGRLLKRFHRISVPFFGNRLDDPRVFPKEHSWRDYLKERFDQELARYQGALGDPPSWRDGLTSSFLDALSLVEDQCEPVFLHGDFHYDNLLFIETGAGMPQLSGVFDLEWAWWGDPMADLLHLEEAFFFYPQDLSPFLKGYGRSDWPTEALKVYRTLHSLKSLSVAVAWKPEPNWDLIALHDERIRLLVSGKNLLKHSGSRYESRPLSSVRRA